MYSLQCCVKEFSFHHRTRLLKFAFISFLIIAYTFPSLSSAAGRGAAAMFARHGSYKPTQGADAAMEGRVNERLLRVNTGDYGRYNPAPTFAKPRFKLIPN
ncbi:unnamed protein product [Rhodiola kirilowii]